MKLNFLYKADNKKHKQVKWVISYIPVKNDIKTNVWFVCFFKKMICEDLNKMGMFEYIYEISK